MGGLRQREEGIEETRHPEHEADVRYLRQGYEFSLEIDPTGWARRAQDSPDTLAWRTSAMASSSINR